MTVLQLISSAGWYGAETMLLNLSGGLRRMGVRVVVVAFENRPHPHTELAAEASRREFETVTLPCNGRIDYGAVKQLGEFAEMAAADLVHAHGYKADIYAYLAARRLRRPVLATCHNWTGDGFSLAAYGALDRLLLRRVDAVVAVSENVARKLQAAGVPEAKVSLIPNGIDVAEFAAPADAPERFAAGRGPVVGMVGRLCGEKGQHHLLSAAAQIVKRFPEALFVLVGDGPQRAALEEMARSLGLSGNVIFTGHRQDMARLYASMDIVALPSLLEAMPMSVMEAMAAGKPVIATRIGSIPEMLVDGESGFLIDVADIAGLTDRLCALLGDERLRQTMGERARDRAAALFSVDSMARRYLDVYARVIRGSRAAAEAA